MIKPLALEITSIQGDGFHVFVSLKLGRKKLRMLVDTGASRTVFDLNRVLERLPELALNEIDRLSTGLGVSALPGKSAFLHKLTLGDIRLETYETMILDLSHVNQSYHQLKLPKIDGVLGSDLLSRFKAIIDYKNEFILLHPED
ncbi:MAG: retropepsin-like aspartic protease [Bacteroidia bacterium]